MIQIGILVFPDVEELDFIGPFEVLSYINKLRPDSVRIKFISETLSPVKAFNGLNFLPDCTLENPPPLNVLVVPGGKGRLAAMNNENLLRFIRNNQNTSQFVTSVCTGAFLLAKAGLLAGKKATTYHTAFAELAEYGVEVTTAKVVQDGKVITAGGVSSGLELGFYLLRELFGGELAQEVADRIEYKIDVSTL